MSLRGISGHGAAELVSQWDSTIKSLWVYTVTSRYPSWYDFGCCQDVKLQQLTSCIWLAGSMWFSPYISDDGYNTLVYITNPSVANISISIESDTTIMTCFCWGGSLFFLANKLGSSATFFFSDILPMHCYIFTPLKRNTIQVYKLGYGATFNQPIRYLKDGI